jgi:uncharacterized protein (TIGR00288 family)
MDFLNIFGMGKPAQPKPGELGKNEVFAVFVDAPNMIRKDAKIDLAEVKEILAKEGRISSAFVYVDQYASRKLIEAVINQGYKAVVTSGDVDVAMAVDSVYYAATAKDITAVVFVTRDTDFVPAITRIKELGKRIYIISLRFGFSAALPHYADRLIMLDQHSSGFDSRNRYNPHQGFKAFQRKPRNEPPVQADSSAPVGKNDEVKQQ